MYLHEYEMQKGMPLSGILPEHDIVIKLDEFDGEAYDDLVQAIIKNSEGSRGIGSFITMDFEQVTRIETHGFRGIKCYEGFAKDTKGRTWFLKIIDEYRAYDVGMEAEDLLQEFMAKYITKEPA
jgi:hypothetical protein